MAPLEKKKMVRSFLEKETSPAEISKDHIQVDLESIKKYFKEYKVDADFASKASPLPESEYSWKCWCCCFCNLNFSDFASHGEHIFTKHSEPLPEGLMAYLPGFLAEFPKEWAKKISETCWKPINVSIDALFTEGCWTPATDWDVSLMSTDTERAKLLESIGMSFKTLLEKKFLHISQFYTVLDYAMGVVEGLPSGKLLMIKGVDRTSTLCFRCLEAPQLEHVRDILRKIELWTGERSPSDDLDNVFLGPQDDGFLAPPDNNIRVVLDRSKSRLLIYADGWFRKCDNSSNGDASWKVNAEAMVSWLYSGRSVEDAVTSWIKSKIVRDDLGPCILKKYTVKFKKMSVIMGLRKYWMTYEIALLTIEAKFEDERKGRAKGEQHAIQSLKAILEGMKESLAEPSEEDSKVCMKAIKQVLMGAEDIKASGNDEYNFDTQNGCDILTENDIIRKALAKEKTELNMKFLQNTAQVKNSLAACHRFEEMLNKVDCIDYLTLVIPSVKSVLREKWEADAMSEALLKEYEETQENCNSKMSKGQKETRRR